MANSPAQRWSARQASWERACHSYRRTILRSAAFKARGRKRDLSVALMYVDFPEESQTDVVSVGRPEVVCPALLFPSRERRLLLPVWLLRTRPILTARK
jgi:hypothetical protein